MMAGHDDNPTFVDIREVTEATPLVNTTETITTSATKEHRRRVILVTFTMLFVISLGAGFLSPGFNVILEEKICREINGGLQAVNLDCKGPAVQGKLAVLRGWQTTIDCIPGLVATVPFGILSDRWGRHRVNTLAFIGMNLNLVFGILVLYFDAIPVDLILASSIFMFIGGGPVVISAMIFTSIADVIPVSERAPIFLEFSALAIVAELISSPIAGLILLKSAWGLLFLTLGLFTLATLISFLLPDTLRLAEGKSDGHGAARHDRDANATNDTQASSPIRESIRRACTAVRDMQSFVNGHRNVIVLMLCFVSAALARVVQEMLLQYTTKRYNWSWSKATFLLTTRSAASLVVLMVVLPALSHILMTKGKLSVIQKDVWIARMTGLAGIIGALMIAYASSVPVLIMGLVVFAVNGGMPPVIRSLLSSMVEPHHMGTLNSFIGVLEMIGLILTAPLLFGGLRLGFEMGGGWIGLPFICAAAMISLSTAIVYLLPIGDKEGSSSFSRDDEMP